jgi:hypothetical protein
VLQGFDAQVIGYDLSDTGNGIVQIQANAVNRLMSLGQVQVFATGTASTGTFTVGTDSHHDSSVTDLALLSLMQRWASNSAPAGNDTALDQGLVSLALEKQAHALSGNQVDLLFSGG